MSNLKQNQIPTTSFVAPYPIAGQSMDVKWNMAVANFCNGAQSIKNNNGILSARIGNMVFIEGNILLSNGTTQTILPVLPRQSGFLTGFDSLGNVKGIAITINTKEIQVTEDLYINGAYIAQIKEK